MDTQNNQSIIQFTNPELVESIFMENPNYSGSEKVSQKLNISSEHDKIVEENRYEKSTTVSLTVTNFDKIDMNRADCKK